MRTLDKAALVTLGGVLGYVAFQWGGVLRTNQYEYLLVLALLAVGWSAGRWREAWTPPAARAVQSAPSLTLPLTLSFMSSTQEFKMTLAFPKISLLVCALCLLIAVAVGAYRHWCIYLWKRTAILLIAEGEDNKTQELRLGAHVPAWKSRQVRIGSWLLVAASSTLGAAFGTVLLQCFDIGHCSDYFLGILLTRWLLSALLGRGLAKYATRQAENLHIDQGEVCQEVLEFCGFTPAK